MERHTDGYLTLGECIANLLTDYFGSWRFLITFNLALVLWIVINSVGLFQHPFDPYPYILLNLILSCIAAMQAPIIMIANRRLYEEDQKRDNETHEVILKIYAKLNSEPQILQNTQLPPGCTLKQPLL